MQVVFYFFIFINLNTGFLKKSLYTTIVRDGKEVDYITNNKYYDFNYQNYNFLSRPLTLRKVRIEEEKRNFYQFFVIFNF